MNRWYLIAKPTLSLWDRVRLLCGVPLFVRFWSPDGNCHAACSLAVVVQRNSREEPWEAQFDQVQS